MAPAKMVEDAVGTVHVYEEQAFQAIDAVMKEIIENEKLEIITRPNINIVKMGVGSELIFKADLILMPTVELCDYKKIAKSTNTKEESTEVSEKEINEYINYLLKMKVQAEMVKKQKDNPEEKIDPKAELALPELNDEFAKVLGFENVEAFKTEITKNLVEEKSQKNVQKKRAEMIENIISESKVDMPEILIEEELERMMAQFRADIKSMGMEPENYLTEIKKSEEDLKKEWRDDAEKRAKMNFIIPRIAVEEKIKPDMHEVDHQVKHILEHHPEINPQDAKIYYTQIALNQEVFKFLEELK